MSQNAESKARTAPVAELLGMSFAKSAYPMYVFDRDTLAFLDVNDAAIRQYGHSRQWFLATTILDIRPTAEIPKLLLEARDPRWQKGGATAESWYHQTRSGTVFPVTITAWGLTFRGHLAKLVLARKSAGD